MEEITTDVSEQKSRDNGIRVKDLRASSEQGLTRLQPFAKHCRGLLESAAWRDFSISTGRIDRGADGQEDLIYERRVYGPGEFAKFLELELDRMRVSRLLGLLRLIGGPDAEVAGRLVRRLVPVIGAHGGARVKKPTEEGSDNLVAQTCSTDSTYFLARLKRDHPDLAQQVEDRILSITAAAEKAGYRDRTNRLPADPKKAAAKLRKKDPKFADELVEYLSQTDPERPATDGVPTAGGRPEAATELADLDIRNADPDGATTELGAEDAIEFTLPGRKNSTRKMRFPGRWLVSPEAAGLSEPATPLRPRVAVAEFPAGEKLALVRSSTHRRRQVWFALIVSGFREGDLSNPILMSTVASALLKDANVHRKDPAPADTCDTAKPVEESSEVA
jgi:hypothetical protein